MRFAGLMLAALLCGQAVPDAVTASKPDPTKFSYTIWPKGTISNNQVKSAQTQHGKLVCRGGRSGGSSRICSWK